MNNPNLNKIDINKITSENTKVVFSVNTTRDYFIDWLTRKTLLPGNPHLSKILNKLPNKRFSDGLKMAGLHPEEPQLIIIGELNNTENSIFFNIITIGQNRVEVSAGYTGNRFAIFSKIMLMIVKTYLEAGEPILHYLESVILPKDSFSDKENPDKQVSKTISIKGNVQESTVILGNDNTVYVYPSAQNHMEDEQINKKEPPIVDIKGSPYIKNGKMNRSLTSVPILGGKGYERIIPIFVDVLFVQVNISNLPKEINADSTAKNVRAEITYFRPDKTIIGSVSGRWAGERNSDDEEIVELLSNGKSRILYLAMKHDLQDDKDLYMYGMETDTTYFRNRHKDNSYRIEENQIFIKLEIIGERVQVAKEFVLYNEETGLRIEILK